MSPFPTSQLTELTTFDQVRILHVAEFPGGPMAQSCLTPRQVSRFPTYAEAVSWFGTGLNYPSPEGLHPILSYIRFAA